MPGYEGDAESGTDIEHADVLIVGGTSLTVYPAAGLIEYYTGSRLVLINKSATPMDSRADLIITAPIGAALGMFLNEEDLEAMR